MDLIFGICYSDEQKKYRLSRRLMLGTAKYDTKNVK